MRCHCCDDIVVVVVVVAVEDVCYAAPAVGG